LQFVFIEYFYVPRRWTPSQFFAFRIEFSELFFNRIAVSEGDNSFMFIIPSQKGSNQDKYNC